MAGLIELILTKKISIKRIKNKKNLLKLNKNLVLVYSKIQRNAQRLPRNTLHL